MYGKKLNKGADDCRKLTPDNACKIDYAEATFDAVVSILVFSLLRIIPIKRHYEYSNLAVISCTWTISVWNQSAEISMFS